MSASGELDVAGLAGATLSRRQLLAHWNIQFRNHAAVSRVSLDLSNAGLTTVPDLAVGPIDGEIRVVRLADSDAGSVQGHPPGGATPDTHQAVDVEDLSHIVRDPLQPVDTGDTPDSGGSPDEAPGEDPVGLLPQTALRISVFSSAVGGAVSVMPDDTLPKAMSIMAERGFSQLPVLDGLGALQGVVTWASIAHMHATGREATVRNALTSEYHAVESTAYLLPVVPMIQAYGFVLVRSAAGSVTGIVTTADLADQFVAIARPFFVLGEIERRLRRCLSRVYGEDDVRQVHRDRRRRQVDQLMFGEYVRLLDDEERWKKLNWPGVDRGHFVGLLRRVKDVRNGVMHFNSGYPDDEATALLDRFVGILRGYDPDSTA
ncbi:CBS domain-containing protein [Streptomyces sp. SID12501]|uniref:CBS domain-containing protein n=1 Tax=Streptomyces sp. SID12501 TaxID=2706042 RepID=A0A6B3BU05_9ACTN|nr:CBS domain-containing protein [Streptomyces sp. SID12501]NEC87844.1 CBS domain-containing protein [Streptomyces sp. SID12501]